MLDLDIVEFLNKLGFYIKKPDGRSNKLQPFKLEQASDVSVG